jgi:transposase
MTRKRCSCCIRSKGVGDILALTILYEIDTIERFPRVQDFSSYCRLVKPEQRSAGKKLGTSGGKIGSAHLKWAFSEAAVCFLHNNPRGQAYIKRLRKRYGRGKALSIRRAARSGHLLHPETETSVRPGPLL